MSEKKQKVISFKNLPYRMPIYQTVSLWLLADRFQVPEMMWGFVWAFIFLLWTAWVYGITHTEEVDILEE